MSLSLSVPFCLSFCLFLYLFFLSDKLDEILAAAQQTISTNEAPGTRGQGPKRDRGRSFYGNEVRIVKHASVIYLWPDLAPRLTELIVHGSYSLLSKTDTPKSSKWVAVIPYADPMFLELHLNLAIIYTFKCGLGIIFDHYSESVVQWIHS